ncbi:MAG: mechanosensitive ion channel family protein [Candidatus Eisenbacteria bacterium]
MSFEGTTYSWISAAVDLAIVLAAFVVGRLVARLLSRLLARIVRRTATQADDLLVEVVARHLPWWIAAVTAVTVARVGPGSPGLVHTVDRVAQLIVTLSVTLALASFLSGLLERRILPIGGGVGATTLTRKLLWWIIVVVGAMVALSGLGVEITPLLAALGIGSLAVGLALQPTLTNVFAGFNLSLAQRMRVGDFVRLEGGQEGRIVDIGWRSTEIRSIGDSIILVPNAKLAEIIVTNYSLPGDEVALPFEVMVASGSDLEHVERVALDEARVLQQEVEGAVPGHLPIVRYLGFADSAIRLVIILRARAYPDRVVLTHEFLKRLKRRFEHEKIEVPYPQRVVRTIGGAPLAPGGELP